jgi:tetrapyrrole methylase family protein / MazG family protein
MNSTQEAFERAYSIVKRLRGPGGCPWDIEQTPQTLRGSLIEEAYEAVEAINEADPEHVKEELGDVFLLVIMIGYMYEQTGEFTLADSLNGLSDKLIRRHPHVFGESDADTSEKVLKQWAEIKVNVEGRPKKDSILDEVSHALPPLERAYKIQKKAAKVGFDWLEEESVWDKLREELEESREACRDGSTEKKEDEIGDLLFSAVNVARFMGIDPMVALHRTIGKFSQRFKYVEKKMKDSGREMNQKEFDFMDGLWNEAKATIG